MDSRYVCSGADDCALRVWDVNVSSHAHSRGDGVTTSPLHSVTHNGQGVICALSMLQHNQHGMVYGTKLGQLALVNDERHRL